MSDAGVRNSHILRVLRGTRLPCGCVAGIYETYSGATVAVVDEVDAGCRLAEHRNGGMIDIEASDSLASGTRTW
jgi:hypothetical protein